MRGVSVLAVAVAALILSAPDARAGGVPVQLAAVRSTLWAVSDNGLLAVDLRTSRIVARPELPYAYPIRVAAGLGALWVASVANGYGGRGSRARDRRPPRLRLRPRRGRRSADGPAGAAWKRAPSARSSSPRR